MSYKQELMEKFPLLFTNKEGQTVNPIGVDVPDGWQRTVTALCHAINEMVRPYNEGDQRRIEFFVVQVKEKFGGLRFYYNAGDDKIYGMVRLAEYICQLTCEVSGEPGELCVRGGWYKTLSSKVRTEDPKYKGFQTLAEVEKAFAERDAENSTDSQ